MTGLLKKFCNTFHTSAKINSKRNFFFWLILNVHHLLQHHRTIYFLNSAWGFVKMVWYGNVQFNQWTVTTFLVAYKEAVTNI